VLRRIARSAAALAGMAVLVAACSPAASRPALATAACGRPFRPGLQHDLQNVAAIVRKTYQIPGMAVAVTVPGEGCWVSATGLANTARHLPLTLDDAFPIGSITKTFTATVILQLVQRGKLSLSAPVSRWVPYVRHARQITVGMLLQMTSGIENEPGGRLFKQMVSDPGRAWTPQQVVRLAVAAGPAGPPGRFSYSNTNYIILGMIAQAVTGQPIRELITTRILRPLHLRRTSFGTAAVVQGYGVGHGRVTDITPEYDSRAAISVAGAAYGMTSTVGDLQVWARALATGSLLSAAAQGQRLHLIPASGLGSFRPLPGTAGPATIRQRYGLGVAAVGRWLGHDGSVTGGYTADMFYLPAARATIVVLVNGRNLPFEAAEGEAVSDAAAASIAQIVVPGGLR
jgi:D-alanyl-D-alanine carboxypeptidase